MQRRFSAVATHALHRFTCKRFHVDIVIRGPFEEGQRQPAS